MTRYNPDMTSSQRALYNDRQRRKHLERQLRAGKVPHPKRYAPWLLSLYQKYGVENRVMIPMAWMTPADIKRIRNRERYQRSLKPIA